MANQNRDRDGIYWAFLYNPGFTGWKRQPCSICGVIHPANCAITQDPEWLKALSDYYVAGGKLGQK